MSRQVSRGPAGEYQEDEQAGVARNVDYKCGNEHIYLVPTTVTMVHNNKNMNNDFISTFYRAFLQCAQGHSSVYFCNQSPQQLLMCHAHFHLTNREIRLQRDALICSRLRSE